MANYPSKRKVKQINNANFPQIVDKSILFIFIKKNFSLFFYKNLKNYRIHGILIYSFIVSSLSFYYIKTVGDIIFISKHLTRIKSKKINIRESFHRYFQRHFHTRGNSVNFLRGKLHTVYNQLLSLYYNDNYVIITTSFETPDMIQYNIPYRKSKGIFSMVRMRVAILLWTSKKRAL